MQQLLVWKFILWISSPTVEKLDSIAGIQLVKRSLVVSEMDISKYLWLLFDLRMILKMIFMLFWIMPCIRNFLGLVIDSSAF
jgi:hypothetical protein